MFPVHLSFALPWARQGPWPAPGNRKAPQKQKGGRGVRVGGGKDQRFGRQSSSSTVLKIDTGIKKVGSLCLPEETVPAGPLFAGEEEISRFSTGAPAPARAVPQVGAVPRLRAGHGGPRTAGAPLGSQGISPREDGRLGRPASLCRLGCRERPEPPAGRSRSWDGLWG